GPGLAHGVVVTDTVPVNSGTSWSVNGGTAAASCLPISGGVLTCNIGDLASGASVTVHLTSLTTSATCGTVNNTGAVTTSNDGSDSSSASITVNCPHVNITKAADNATVNSGDPMGFTIMVGNSGAGVARSVSLSDSLPTGVTWLISPAYSGPGTCSLSGATPQILSCAFGDMNSGASVSVHVSATAPNATQACTTLSYPNVATASATNDGSVQANATITVDCPNLTITKTADAISVNAGSPIGFTVTLTNAGPGDANGVTLTDTLPSGLGVSWTIASQSGPATCAISGAPPAQSISCGSFTLLAGTSQIVHVTSSTSSASCGNYNNSASFTTTNDGSGSAPASEAVECPTSVTTSLSGGGSSGPSITINTGTSVTDQATISGAGPAAGGTVHYQYTTDPTCATGLVDAGTASVLAGVAGPSNAVIFNTGGKFYWIATYSGDTSANTGGSISACGAEVLTVLNPQVSQITPTQTTCAMFASGTASTLGSVFYATNKGTTITSDNPGVMFYWVKITVVTGGNHTYTITQSTTYTPAFGNNLFNVAAGSFAYDSNCNTLSTTLGSDPSNLTVAFKGAPGVYYIGIKYSPKSIVGSGPASTTPGSSYTYTFATTGVGGSTSTIKLTHQ
ncbi:MAG TPA: hypothetical protein VGX22_00315, partial [Candidatus Dormibacteraeota bacterium]|nr:hypothetical protein [Candidatus Dormibacteraeota bacterium]